MSGIFTEADIPQTESHLHHKNHITELTMSRIDNQMLWAIKILSALQHIQNKSNFPAVATCQVNPDIHCIHFSLLTQRPSG